MDNATRRKLRGIAHHLDPIVTVGDGGVSDALLAELERALVDHELVKVRMHHEREDRDTIRDALCEAARCELVQQIGKTITLYRANPKANPKLSNVNRYG